MKIIERKRYGSRGEGSLVRYDGVENWYSVYCAHGKEIRQTTGTADFKTAKKSTRACSTRSPLTARASGASCRRPTHA
jgi:hypothetical protein